MFVHHQKFYADKTDLIWIELFTAWKWQNDKPRPQDTDIAWATALFFINGSIPVVITIFFNSKMIKIIDSSA